MLQFAVGEQTRCLAFISMSQCQTFLLSCSVCFFFSTLRSSFFLCENNYKLDVAKGLTAFNFTIQVGFINMVKDAPDPLKSQIKIPQLINFIFSGIKANN